MRTFVFWALAAALLGLTACNYKPKDSPSTKDKGARDGDSEGHPPAKPVTVVMETSKGTIEIELYPDKAPVTVKNFLGYVDDKFFDGTLFHRVIPKFMIQGGGFEPGLVKKRPGPPIKNEGNNGLRNERGTIAMGLLPGRPDSATSEFYINVVDNPHLDPNPDNPTGYCVFGKVVKGMDVVDEINRVPTHTVKGMPDVPKEDVVIKTARRASEKKEKE
jgi:cyclophilin family peptidyl-prolyl cis-trans isomerase